MFFHIHGGGGGGGVALVWDDHYINILTLITTVELSEGSSCE